MAPGARNKFGAPIFQPELFRKQMYCIEKVLVTLGSFGAPIVIQRPGNCVPLPPSLRPCLQRTTYLRLPR